MSADAVPDNDSARVDTSALRVDYDRAELHRADLAPEPLEQFDRWLGEAIRSGLPEPNAMSLATVDAEGAPSVRVVLLKGHDDRGLRFFTNADSAKGREFSQRPQAAACFLWKELHRQVRVRGRVTPIGREESRRYFHSRPRGSQIAAAASPQSQPITDRAALEHLFDATEERFSGRDVELPDVWGGFVLSIERLELWQGRRSRLHDRFVYSRPRPDAPWSIERLAP
ncbi:MAG: pyridoxamine 5'-phosphate oxidase [Acidobacteriota bacterium]